MEHVTLCAEVGNSFSAEGKHHKERSFLLYHFILTPRTGPCAWQELQYGWTIEQVFSEYYLKYVLNDGQHFF